MATQKNNPAVKLLFVAIFLGAIAFGVFHARSRHHARHEPRRFAKVHHLQGGGYCYNDGSQWWYYDTVFNDAGSVGSPTAKTWVPSAKSPAENNLQINAAKDASDPEEVEITAQAQPEQAMVSEAEAAELESQVSDMVNEGNPNNQDMADTDAGTADSESGGDGGGGDGGGGDGGGGDGGGGDGGGGDGGGGD